MKRQTGRDLTLFDLDVDLPDRFLPKFPAPVYLTTYPDLGDMSRGQSVTTDNYYEFFSGILNPKQLEGLRLLLTPLPPQDFNATADLGASTRAWAWPAATATRTATPTGPPTWWGTSGPSSSGLDRDENLPLASRSGTPPRK